MCTFALKFIAQMKEDRKITLTDETREIIDAYLMKMQQKLVKRKTLKQRPEYKFTKKDTLTIDLNEEA